MRTRSISTLVLALLTSAPTAVLLAQPQGRFVDPRPIVGLNSTSLEAAPTVSADGRTVVFISDRPGSIGSPEYGMDLWIATRPDRSLGFGAPMRLGDAVNTDQDDWSPVLTPDGLVLIFASFDVDSDSSDVYMATRDEAYDDVGGAIPFGGRRKVEELSVPGEPDWPYSLDRHGKVYLNRGAAGGAMDVLVATFDRESLSFTEPEPLCGAINTLMHDEHAPSISWDGRVMLWGDLLGEARRPGNAQIWISWRDAVEACFVDHTDAGPLREINTSPDWSPRFSYDWPAPGSKIYFVKNQGNQAGGHNIWEASWRPDEDARELVDDFEDGDFLDSGDLEWTFCDAEDDRSVVDGDVEFGPSPSDAGDLRSAQSFSGDVSVRAQGRIHAGNFLQLGIHESGPRDPCPDNAYWGGIGFGDGGFGAWFGPSVNRRFEFFGTYLDIEYEPDIDYVMELSTSGRGSSSEFGARANFDLRNPSCLGWTRGFEAVGSASLATEKARACFVGCASPGPRASRRHRRFVAPTPTPPEAST